MILAFFKRKPKNYTRKKNMCVNFKAFLKVGNGGDYYGGAFRSKMSENVYRNTRDIPL